MLLIKRKWGSDPRTPQKEGSYHSVTRSNRFFRPNYLYNHTHMLLIKRKWGSDPRTPRRRGLIILGPPLIDFLGQITPLYLFSAHYEHFPGKKCWVPLGSFKTA